ncbi:MAG: GIY-YIG nuclease family protein [Gammaproteobacteria bacterium]|jgi:putative endonuclease
MDGSDWQVYVILCTDNSLYTGITRDVRRRFAQHGGKRGARYFRGRKPLQVVYLEAGHSHSSASRREAAIKKLSRAGKLQLIGPDARGVCGQPSDRAAVFCSV